MNFVLALILINLFVTNLNADSFINLKQPQNDYEVLAKRPVYVVYKNPIANLQEQVGWVHNGSYIVELYGEEEIPGWVNIRFAYMSRSADCAFDGSARLSLKEKIEKKFSELIRRRDAETQEIKSEIKKILADEKINPDCFNMNEGYIKSYYLQKVDVAQSVNMAQEKELLALAKLEQQKLAKEKAEQEKLEKEEKKKLEREAKALQEKEKQEALLRERQEKLEKLELAKKEKELAALAKLEQQKLAKEKAEQEKLEKEEKKKLEREAKALQEKEKQEAILKEKQAKLEQKKVELEKIKDSVRSAKEGEFCGSKGEVLKFDLENISFKTESTGSSCKVLFLDCGKPEVGTLKKIVEISNATTRLGAGSCNDALDKYYSACGIWKQKQFAERFSDVSKYAEEITTTLVNNQHYSKDVSAELLTCMAYHETKDLNPAKINASACGPRLKAQDSEIKNIDYMLGFESDTYGFGRHTYNTLSKNWDKYLKYEVPVNKGQPSFEYEYGTAKELFIKMIDEPKTQLELVSQQLNYLMRNGASLDSALATYYENKKASPLSAVKQCAKCLKASNNNIDCLNRK